MLRFRPKITACRHQKCMINLPLPEPWTIDTVSQYIDELAKFLLEYGDIARLHSTDVFDVGLPVDWIPEHSLETWIAIVSGEYTGNWSDQFSRFVKLSRMLPLLDDWKPRSLTSKRKRDAFPVKKEHEVEAMVSFVTEMASIHQISTCDVLDVGSGLGYLSAELSSTGFHVIGIEGDPQKSANAIKHENVEHVCKMVMNSTDLEITEKDCISLSLHACGDLSLRMIEHFLVSDNVRLLVNVGCCYNRLSHEGFPISQTCRDKNIQLDRRLRMLAAQATSRWTLESLRRTIRKHFYRAVLQIILGRHHLNPMIRKLPDRFYDHGFEEYVRAIVQKLQLPTVLINEAGIIHEHSDRDITAAVCLRGMCTAVVESLIVLDRWMAVREEMKDGYVGLHRIFHAQISPRGWAVVATR